MVLALPFIVTAGKNGSQGFQGIGFIDGLPVFHLGVVRQVHQELQDLVFSARLGRVVEPPVNQVIDNAIVQVGPLLRDALSILVKNTNRGQKQRILRKYGNMLMPANIR